MIVSRMLEKVSNSGEMVMAQLRDLELTEEGLVLKETGDIIEMDEVGLNIFGRYLGINKSYLRKCPPVLQRSNVNFWLDENPDAMVRMKVNKGLLLEAVGQEEKAIPHKAFLEYFTDHFLKKDKTTHFDISDSGRLEVDITHKYCEYELEGQEFLGGVRGTSHPGSDDGAPTLTPILYHKETGSTLAFPSSMERVSFRRKEVSEVLDEVRDLTQWQIKGDGLRGIYNYISSHPTELPGDVTGFLTATAEKRELSKRVLQVLLSEVEEKSPATLLELSLVVAVLANGSLSHTSKMILQGMAGDMLLTPSFLSHRCEKCGSVVVE